MNTDIRINVGFPDHWKTDALISDCGYESILCLMRLWIFTAQNKPNGVLDGIDEKTIERIAKWKGEPGALTDCLINIRFIDKHNESCFILHDWEEHNPYAAKAEFRRERAKKANAVRWGKKEHETKEECLEDTNSILVASSDDPPSPSPSPSPFSPSPSPEPIYKQVVAHLNKKTKKQFKSSNRKTQSLINSRIKEGFTRQDFITVIDNKHTKWFTDPKMCEYLRPETLFGTKFESYLNDVPHPLQGKVSSRTIQNIQNMENWEPPK